MKMPCCVCQYPVEVETAEERVYIDPVDLSKPDGQIAVCGAERCQRLLFEVLQEEGRVQLEPAD